MNEKIRCDWAESDSINRDYHDHEWGYPIHDDAKLFEMLILETMQAGLSWSTILKKRDAFLQAFDGFDIHKIIQYDATKIESLMQNKGIIRNRLKINSVITNAQLFLAIQKEFGSFDTYIWSFVENTPIVGNWQRMEDVPATTELSDRISKDLKKRGFKFVGSTIVYAYMQAIGLVNDHLVHCFCY